MLNIIGNGLIAKVCAKDLDHSTPFTIFACGASNKSAILPAEREREATLLKDTLAKLPDDHTFVYFGTCSLYDPSENASAYCIHKTQMEAMIAEHSNRSILLRLPQVVGHHGNPQNLANFLIQKIRTDTEFDLWTNAHRTMLDAADVSKALYFLSRLNLAGQHHLNMTLCQPLPVQIIVQMLEEVTHHTARVRPINKGKKFTIDTSLFEELIGRHFPIRNEAYIRNTLQTYFG